MSALDRSDILYLRSVLALGFLLRLFLVGVWTATNAIYHLRLSPDSERYHRFGLLIMQEMEQGNFNWSNWIDNGWFQFTGFVYYLFGPAPLIIQLINVVFSTLTVWVVFHIAYEVSRSSRVARVSALMVAVVPSFVYWSSLMLKDSLAILLVSTLVLATLKLRYSMSWLWLLVVLFCLSAFLGIREYMFYVCTALVACSLLLFSPRKIPRAGAIVAVALLGLVPYFLGYGLFGLSAFSESIYLDLDYINHVRVAMGDHGSGAIFDHDNVATWGSGSWFEQAAAFFRGVVFFFFTLNPTDVGSVRQWMALPEALALMLLIPFLVRGMMRLWQDRANSFPLLVFAMGIMLMLVLATTNIGALFRWRMQVMPLFVIALTLGVFCSPGGLAYRLFSRLAGKSI